MYFHIDTEIKMRDGSSLSLKELFRLWTSGDEDARNLSLHSPLLPNGDQGFLLGACDDLDAVRYTFKSGRHITCATNARMVLAGGPGYSSMEDSAGQFPILTDNGPDEILTCERVGRQSLVGVSARIAHAVCVNGVFFLI